MDVLDAYIARLRSEHAAAFVTECTADSELKLMATLIFRVGDRRAAYFQFEPAPGSRSRIFTTNFGVLRIEDGTGVPIDATGGLSTRPGQLEAMKDLTRRPFRLVSTEDLATIRSFDAPPCGWE
ncbi:MAG TPA: hypothetical protein VGS12_00925 [Caulobacteraceae bacterium]|nr:hypothetical protein [Caulobacteraceae bacterium]